MEVDSDGTSYAPAITVQADMRTKRGVELGDAILERIHGGGGRSQAVQAGKAMASALRSLNRYQRQGERILHPDWKWTNLAFTTTEEGAISGVHSFDNGGIRQERGAELTHEYTPLYSDGDTLRDSGFERSLRLGTACRQIDRVHAYTVAANLVVALEDVSGCRSQSDLLQVCERIPGELGKTLAKAMHPDLSLRSSLEDLENGLCRLSESGVASTAGYDRLTTAMEAGRPFQMLRWAFPWID
jgi:hypothetical protein